MFLNVVAFVWLPLLTVAVLLVPVFFCLFTQQRSEQPNVVITGTVPLTFSPAHSWKEKMYDGRIASYTMGPTGPQIVSLDKAR
jgi:hypothetical protein